MDWLNINGLIFVVLLLIPNIVYGLANKDGMEEKYRNKLLEALEQAGRFGCMFFMVFNIPGTAYTACGAREAYLVLGGVLLAAYWLGWLVFRRERSPERALFLSVVPTLLFLESGLLTWNVPLILLAVLFGICHITISCKNAD